MQPGSEPTRRKELREDQQQYCLSAVFPSEEIAIKSKQPTSACGAPLWMKMVAARAGLSESLHGRSC